MAGILRDEIPLTVDPQLAMLIGLNEAIVLQQIQYWIIQNKKARRNLRDGYYWTYNTYKEWQEQFPFWSISTIKRTISKLEKKGILVSGNYNRLPIDRTKWYRIDYKRLEALVNRPLYQIEPMDGSICTDGRVNMNPPLPEIISENTTETTINEANDVCLSLLDYFLKRYREVFKEEHPQIPRKHLPKICKTLNYLVTAISPSTEDAIIEVRHIIDCYFSRELDCDYHIYHFVNPQILETTCHNCGLHNLGIKEELEWWSE